MNEPITITDAVNEPITIIEAAREAAHKEQLFRSDEIRGHYVQIAINAATEQLRADLAAMTRERDGQKALANKVMQSRIEIASERDSIRSDLAAMTKERDAERLSAERWKAAAQINDSNHQLVLATLQSDLATSQQTVAVLRDTERLDFALLHSEWIYKTFCSSTWPFEETKTQLRAAIDAELAAIDAELAADAAIDAELARAKGAE